jgi:hypothetical protein
MGRPSGISNRETADEETRERQEHPSVSEGPPPPQDAAGQEGEAARELAADQTSHKTGSRSIAQKEEGSKYPDRATPSSRKVAGASGREPD